MELLGPVKESASESRGLELRSPDPAVGEVVLKDDQVASGFDAASPGKSAEVGAEGTALASLQDLGLLALSE